MTVKKERMQFRKEWRATRAVCNGQLHDPFKCAKDKKDGGAKRCPFETEICFANDRPCFRWGE